MKISAMFGDVAQAFFQHPATERYPFERRPAPERLRGRLTWDPAKCTGCALCNKDCPANAIELIVLDKKNKRFVMRYRIDRCTFCAQCVENCRFGCLQMAHDEWELAALSKKPLTVYYGREADIEAAQGMVEPARPDAGAPSTT